ncbi:general odorant-binding protein 45-like [Anopheles ziemanni]|uniref:general odorant-binding protein 45-like n=1 Tax=Anopheles coustani TaxID=139045 RepID=UPI0026585AE3|nr:general odorant-binding protein 45-like [Anopheles coustani]XP_058170571.1 general odorant-binding protein 45-like [Anopheles ziemanni]
MRQLVIVLLALVAPHQLLASGCDTKGVIIEKSFLQSVHDCVEYLQIPKERLMQYLSNEFPPDDETKCLVYCVGVDLGWWNNTCGLQEPAIVSYFQPVQGDKQYERRTKECLDRRVGAIESPNSCCQAFETFQCYFQEFGNLVTCPQYVRLTKLQATQAALDCLVMLRYPEDLLKVYARGQVEDCPETRCLYHCIDLRTGLYTHEHGISLQNFFIRDAAFNDRRYLSKETKACRDRIRQSGCDKCTEVYQTHQECLSGLGENGYTSGLITEAAKLALANLGVCCAQPHEQKPCYKPHPPPTHVPCTTPCPGSYHPTSPPNHVYVPKPHPPVPKHSCSVCGNQGSSASPYPSPAAGVVPSVALSYSHVRPSTCSSCGAVDRMYNKPVVHGYRRGSSCGCKACSRSSY